VQVASEREGNLFNAKLAAVADRILDPKQNMGQGKMKEEEAGTIYHATHGTLRGRKEFKCILISYIDLLYELYVICLLILHNNIVDCCQTIDNLRMLLFCKSLVNCAFG
jgi:hypothetical protein